jgi:nitroreductase
VPRGLVQKLVDIARWTPTASNTQPVDWLAIDDPARIAALSAEAVDALARTTRLLRNPLLLPFLRLTVGRGKVNKGVASIPEFETLVQRHRQGEDPIFYRAPVVLVAHVPIDDYFGRDHSIYAVYNLMLAAQRMGLGVCQMGYFALALDRSSALRRALDLPKDRRPEATVILGFQQYRFRRAPLRRRPEITWV